MWVSEISSIIFISGFLNIMWNSDIFILWNEEKPGKKTNRIQCIYTFIYESDIFYESFKYWLLMLIVNNFISDIINNQKWYLIILIA